MAEASSDILLHIVFCDACRLSRIRTRPDPFRRSRPAIADLLLHTPERLVLQAG